MSAKFDRIVKKISNSVKTSQEKKTSAYDTTAKVLRVDGDTAWVHIPGGVDETPVRLTVNATAGDEVQVRVGGGDAWLVGNGSAPPTDDKVAKFASGQAVTADKKATTAKKSADEALDGVKKQREFFWHDDDGAHVLSDADGTTGTRYRTDVKGAGLEIFKVNQDGTEESVAKFGETTQIGGDFDAHSVLDANGQRFYGNASILLAHIGYGQTNTSSGTDVKPYYTFGTRKYAIYLYSETETYNVGDMCVYDDKMYVCKSDIEVPETFNAAHWDYHLGGYSHAVGEDTVASGSCSHAEGGGTEAIGNYSHAQNTGTIAGYDHQTAIGKYNSNNSNNAFEVGNGNGISGDPKERSNAFTVDWNGNVEASGGFTSPTLTQSFTSQYVANIYVEKWGKIVSITLNNMKSVPANSSVNLFTLPSGWRPSHVCMWLLRNPTDNYRLRVSIGTDGVVSVYNYTASALPASSNATQTCTFITAQKG